MRMFLSAVLAISLTACAFAANNPYGVHMLSFGSNIQDWARLLTCSGSECGGELPLPSSGTGSITGRAIDPYTGLGIPGVSITVLPGGTSTSTDSNGDYTVSNLAPSTYSVTAWKYSYRASPTSGLL